MIAQAQRTGLVRAIARGIAGSLALCGFLSTADALPQRSFGKPRPVEQQGTLDTRAFQIYDTQAARAIQQEAEEHLAAGRLREGLADLQKLLEGHHGEVLSAQHPTAEGAANRSKQAVHPGASSWALERLFDLPTEAQELYRSRYGPRADLAYQRARAEADSRALVDVGSRWPLTVAAERAWWTVGDLETEAGRFGPGRVAWARALSLALGQPDRAPQDSQQWMAALSAFEDLAERADALESVRARVSLVLQKLEEEFRADAAGTQWANALRPGHSLGKPFSSRTEPWPLGYSLPPHPYNLLRQGRFRRPVGNYPLYPVRGGDTVFLSTSLQLVAVEAFTGQERWRSSTSSMGWDPEDYNNPDFFRGIDQTDSLQAPAVQDGVAVAALQIPYLFLSSDYFKELDIIVPLPERRLMAFDALTGELLWDTLPPSDWDGESGSYAERANVVGPPVVAGNRVLVPTARMRGRIEFHVGCFDLNTGQVLWHAPLITGQRELNMFGRGQKEFSAPPVVVQGDRVFVQTQLGTVASLDLFTGNVQWQSLYPQLPISEATFYQAGEMDTVWSNSPPALAGSTLVAAPVDSRFLLGYDVDTGAVLWHVEHDQLSEAGRRRGGSSLGRPLRGRTLSYLIDAGKDQVILGGERIASFRSPSGNLKSAPPELLHWTWPAKEALSRSDPRPVLDDKRLCVPYENLLVSIDRATGRLISEHEWGDYKGNLLITDGQLFSLGKSQLWGFFEWDTLLAQAEAGLEADPEDESQLILLAKLLIQRANAARKTPSLNNLQMAARTIRRSRKLLDERVASHGSSPELDQARYDALHEAAWIHRGNADGRQALTALELALELASSARQRLTTELLTLSLLRDRDENARMLVLTRLHDEFGPIQTTCVVLDGNWTPDQGPWRGRLEPTVASAEVGANASVEYLPIGLWTLIERLNSRLSRSSEEGLPSVFADLHRILAEYSEVPFLGETAGDWAADHVGELLAKGLRNGYQRFADEANGLLEEAISAGDLQALADIPLLYPYSPAANRANDARISLSLERGDAGLVAEIVLGELGEDWSYPEANEREVRNLVRLAEVVGETGNTTMRAALTRRLAEFHGSLELDTPSLGKQTVSALAKTWSEDNPKATEVPETNFSSTATAAGLLDTGLRWIAQVETDRGSQRSIYASRARRSSKDLIYALGKDPSKPVWTGHKPDSRLFSRLGDYIAVSAGLVHVATRKGLTAMNAEDGSETWIWIAQPSSEIQHLVCDQGVVVVTLERSEDDDIRTRLFVALDASTGAELWRLAGVDDSYNDEPIVGSGYLVLLPSHSGAAEVFDIFTGTQVSRFDLRALRNYDARGTWIQDGQLILPRFFRVAKPHENHVLGIDLATGKSDWQIDIPAGQEIHCVFRFQGNVVLQLNQDNEEDESVPGLYRLNTRLGSLERRPLASLPPGSGFLGLRDHSIELEHSTLIAFVEGRNEAARLRAIDVRLGRSWEVSLPAGFRATRASDLPVPVASPHAVALVLATDRATRSAGAPWGLVFLDRGTGALAKTEALVAGDASALSLRLQAEGLTLLVSDNEKTELFR